MMAAITSAMIRRPTERSRSAEDAVTSRRTLRSGAPAAVISRSHDAPHCPVKPDLPDQYSGAQMMGDVSLVGEPS
jgi:hypothetical protein